MQWREFGTKYGGRFEWPRRPRHTPAILLTIVIGLNWAAILSSRIAQASPSLPIGIAVTILVMIVNVGLTVLVFLAALRIIKAVIRDQELPAALSITFIAGVWALAELIAAWGSAFAYYGRGAQLDTLLPFSTIGVAFINTPLGYLSRLVGLFGLSGVIVALVAILVTPRLRRYATTYLLVVAVATVAMAAIYSTPHGQKLSVATVSAHGSEHMVQQSELTGAGDLAVTPEYTLDLASSDQDLKSTAAMAGPRAFLVGSRHATSDGHNYNLLITAGQKVIYSQPKHRLVPLGEYLPYPLRWTLGLFGLVGALNAFDHTQAITPGPKPVAPVLISKGVMLGAEVCSSVMVPEDFRRIVASGATVLSNSAAIEKTKYAWSFDSQYRQLIHFYATANARPFIQSAVDADAFVLDQNGRQMAVAHSGHTAYAIVTSNNERTPYSVIGEWLALIGFCATTYIFLTRK